MLTREENELLTRVGQGSPMGELMRRHWIPALLSEQLPTPDCDPVRVRLLGEDLVAFRDSDGRVGLLEELCPHRRASLFYGRNEEGGLRCLYHGWKMDVDGRVLETPCEPADSTFKDRVRHTAYPTYERRGMVWAYLGPIAKKPPFPGFEWTQFPETNVSIAKSRLECNYLQGVEGDVDSSHLEMLHSGRVIMDKLAYVAPHYEVEETAFGLRYAAIRVPPFRINGSGELVEDPLLKYVRTAHFVIPFCTLVPPQANSHMQFFVPIDDETTWLYSVCFNAEQPIDHERMLIMRHVAIGPDLNSDRTKIRSFANSYLQDRQAMREKRSWSGIDANPNQDGAMTESMGAILDRTKEHLAFSDTAVIRVRERLLDTVRAFQDGREPTGLDRYAEVRSHNAVVGADLPWQDVERVNGAFASGARTV